MKSYIVEVKNHKNEVKRYIDVIAENKKSARAYAEKATRVYHNLGETLGKALERGVDVNYEFDSEYNVVNVVRL